MPSLNDLCFVVEVRESLKRAELFLLIDRYAWMYSIILLTKDRSVKATKDVVYLGDAVSHLQGGEESSFRTPCFGRSEGSGPLRASLCCLQRAGKKSMNYNDKPLVVKALVASSGKKIKFKDNI